MSAGWLVAGLLLIPTWPSLFTMVASILCFVKYGKQASERSLYNRFHRYCAVIGMRGRVPIKELREVSGGMSKSEVRDALQKMIVRGYFGRDAYIDMTRNELVLPDVPEGAQARQDGRDRGWKDVLFDLLNSLRSENVFQGEARAEDLNARARTEQAEPRAQRAEPEPNRRPEPEPRPAPRPAQPQKPTYAEELERTLNELYQLNAQIEDEAVSQRIDRIGTLTAGIFRAVIEKPEREQDVRKFMNYYLPTTLKLLRSYSLMEKQTYQSANIAESRKKIEEILDALIQGFEKLLDRLFKDDALDIATDIDVLEMMMAGDGLM